LAQEARRFVKRPDQLDSLQRLVDFKDVLKIPVDIGI